MLVCIRILVIIIIGYYLTGCGAVSPMPDNDTPSVTPIRNSKNIMDTRNSLFIAQPVASEFSICYGHTCQNFAHVSLDKEEWDIIRQFFDPPAGSPQQEREQIRIAVGMLEHIVGKKTGTANDKGENFQGLGLEGQMDCVDESTNITVYLTMLQGDGLLRWHVVDHRTSRGISSFQVPHFTAVIRDIENGIRYAVDSWFLDNGEPPFVLPLTIWENGWKPESSL